MKGVIICEEFDKNVHVHLSLNLNTIHSDPIKATLHVEMKHIIDLTLTSKCMLHDRNSRQ